MAMTELKRRAAASREALAGMAQRETNIAQEKAALWLDIASAGFAALPAGCSGLALLHWDKEEGHMFDPIARCPAGLVVAHEALLKLDEFGDPPFYMSRIRRGDMVIWETIKDEAVLPGAPWAEIEMALFDARAGLKGFMRAHLTPAPGAPGSDGQRVWDGKASGKCLLDAASFARALGMPSAAALWEAKEISLASALAHSKRRKPLRASRLFSQASAGSAFRHDRRCFKIFRHLLRLDP